MLVIIIYASASDSDHINLIIDELKKLKIPCKEFILSAHKVPEKVFKLVSKYNITKEAICYITVAGRSNGLSGVVAANAVHPVIACPCFKSLEDYSINIHSSLQMPSDAPVMTILDPRNAVQAVARIFGLMDAKMRAKIVKRIKEVKEGY